jgi:hypothetical protein
MLDFPPKPCTVLNRHLVPGVKCCAWITAVSVNSDMRTHIPGLDQISWIKTYPQKSPTLLKPRDLPKDTLDSKGTGGGGDASTTIVILFCLFLAY